MPDRLNRIRAAMDDARLDALLVSGPVDDIYGRHSQNRFYVSGFTGSAGHVLITPTRSILAVDFRYTEQAEREAVPRGFEVLFHKEKTVVWLAQLFGEAGLAGKRLGVSPADMSVEEYGKVQEAATGMPDGQRPEVTAAPKIIEKLRERKDAAELAQLQRSIDICDAAFEDVAAGILPGQTEHEVALAVQASVRAHGAEDVSFDTIVAAGPWGAMPHASPRREPPIGYGDGVVIDMGARAGGYCSDLTRTIVAGTPPDPKFEQIYEIVHEAQQIAIAKVESGMKGPDVHDLAHSVIEGYGYGEQFGHGLGHGIGLDVHEAPYIGKTSEDTIEEGMVFTIEPGIYIPGWGGIRIEDIVVLENGRARVLSHAAKLIPAGATR